ncbi:MAG: hypothetical protein J0I34_05060 [Pseudonocardia sp.]|uniref:hypothetical protein n=1 Tax=unclassified Pseudonocardia TaxID=2619320 RepID=UPI00086AE8DA|nr:MULTISPECIES: hypothetical protein [unclassified Pseudonocardia]MBN9108132.1 hypothetical protein [Pseudonocardia sp.]ODV06187.1 MAG: hypothetical protein ABT15_13950 [Pseudonocardia sp. SCN 73-27]
MTTAYWIAVVLAGVGLLTMAALALSLGLRLRRLARDAGSVRAGISAATGPITAAVAAGRARRGTPDR